VVSTNNGADTARRNNESRRLGQNVARTVDTGITWSGNDRDSSGPDDTIGHISSHPRRRRLHDEELVVAACRRRGVDRDRGGDPAVRLRDGGRNRHALWILQLPGGSE